MKFLFIIILSFYSFNVFSKPFPVPEDKEVSYDVIRKKKIIIITIGAIILPKTSPSFIQELFRGLKITGFKRDIIKKTNPTANDQSLIGIDCMIGQKAIMRKTIKNSIPKLLSLLLGLLDYYFSLALFEDSYLLS